ncbi:MAG TPA: PD-(D/E)XK nuclease family protein [Candidatus Nanopelagicales bacterium]|nr:PD-(D/E)XK nuclease family protein [Candidatus Nanopelagicales bacterium]
MTQGTFDAMPRRLFSCTPTKLDTWLSCPRRYRFTYLERRQKGLPWAHNSVGSSVHNALRDWWLLPAERRTPEAASELVSRNWLTDGFRDGAQAAEWRDRAAAMTESYAAGLDPDDEPIGVERTVSARTTALALQGRVDRIDLRPSEDGGEELVIVDYKTGRRPLSVDDARSSLALAVYVVAARTTLRKRSRRVELHHLPTATVAAYDHSEESLDRHLRRAEQIAADAQAAQEVWSDDLSARAEDAAAGDADAIEAIDAVLPPQPGPMCSWCDYRRHCPEGRDASTALEPWAGLATDFPAPDAGDAA